jgi:hypothetical protein
MDRQELGAYNLALLPIGGRNALLQRYQQGKVRIMSPDSQTASESPDFQTIPTDFCLCPRMNWPIDLLE